MGEVRRPEGPLRSFLPLLKEGTEAIHRRPAIQLSDSGDAPDIDAPPLSLPCPNRSPLLVKEGIFNSALPSIRKGLSQHLRLHTTEAIPRG